MPKLTPFLWYDTEAEAAANFYVTVFKNSRLLNVTRYGDAGPGPKGSVMTVDFELDGQPFTALNGGPHFTFDEAISFTVHCKTQDEVDFYWETLSAGGKKGDCGWLKDKFGLSWQITPDVLTDLLKDQDPARQQRVMAAMMTMQKIDIALLQQAAGRS